MTQEDKELLLKDLCARLPYIPIIYVDKRLPRIKICPSSEVLEYIETSTPCKPYLRSMSSMTEEERTEYLNACGNEMDNALSSPRYSGIDWLNAHHFDYRGLIEKGLVLEAPEGMYK